MAAVFIAQATNTPLDLLQQLTLLAVLLLGLALAPMIAWRYFDAYLLGMILVVAYAAPPFARIQGAVASVSTLLMIVGLPNRPSCTGRGGLARTKPRLPSRLSSNAVSSPHT